MELHASLISPEAILQVWHIEGLRGRLLQKGKESLFDGRKLFGRDATQDEPYDHIWSRVDLVVDAAAELFFFYQGVDENGDRRIREVR